MKTPSMRILRKLLLVMISSVLVCGGFTSCRTAQGFGQDVKKVGSKIENEAAQHG